MSETPETIDSLRQQLRVANRIKQAAIDCTKSWDNVQDELVWERQDLDAHEIPAEHVQTMIARYPHYAADITDFATRWNADKPLTDAELADMEIDEEAVKRSTASCLMMLKWSTRIRKAEQTRDELAAALAARNKQLGVACTTHDLTHALACGHCFDELAAALRELNNATEDMRRRYGEDENANIRCTAAQERAHDLLARLDAEKS